MDKTNIVDFIRSIDHLKQFHITEVEKKIIDGNLYKAIYLEFQSIGDQPVRLFLWLGIPQGTGPFPTILHIHGGGQTHSLRDVIHWVNLGYVACSYDWTGTWANREFVSDLSKLPSGENTKEYGPEHSVMYSRVVVAKSVISWLLAQPQVDPQSLGVYGISWGGAIVCILHHYERRVKTYVSVYGCGKHFTEGRLHHRFRKLQQWGEMLEWERLLDGFTLAGLASDGKAPLLMLNGTNDYWGWMDTACDMLVRLPEDKRSVSFSANMNHHLDRWSPSTLGAWMYSHLCGDSQWPKAPQVSIRLNDEGKLVVLVDVIINDDFVLEQVRFCWSWGELLEVPPPSRYWHIGNVPNSERFLEIPVLDITGVFYLYVDSIYKNGIKISSLPVRISPQYEGVLKPTETHSLIFGDYSNHLTDGWQYPMVYVDPLDPDVEYAFGDDDEGNAALSLATSELPFHLTTYKFIDPKWKIGSNDTVLYFKLCGIDMGIWEFEFVYKPGNSGQKSWKYSRPSQEGWHVITIRLEDWRNEAGHCPPFWNELQQLIISFVQGEETMDITRLALGRVWDARETKNSNRV